MITLQVRAVDEAGNRAPLPCSRLDWTFDTQLPNSTVISPSHGFVARNLSLDVTIEATEPLSTVLVRCGPEVEFLHLSELTSGERSSGGGARVSLLAHAVGLRRVWLTAVDLAGNQQRDALEFSWSIDVTPPVLILDRLADLPTVSASRRLPFWWTASEPVTRIWSAVVEDGRLARQNPWLVHSSVGSGPSVRGNFSVTAPPNNGRYVLQLKAEDVAGNVWEGRRVWNWTQDTAPPTCFLESGPSTPSFNSTVSFRINCSNERAGWPGMPDCALFRCPNTPPSSLPPPPSPPPHSYLSDLTVYAGTSCGLFLSERCSGCSIEKARFRGVPRLNGLQRMYHWVSTN